MERAANAHATHVPVLVVNHHSIGERAEVVLKVTGADAGPGEYRDSEVLTTKIKRVGISKSVRDLGHRNSHGLEEGMGITADWMRGVYGLG